jgi:hypothetical protein
LLKGEKMSYYSQFTDQTKHKVFLSFYHHDDEYYKHLFEGSFGHIFINKSVHPGDIATDNSDEYIKHLIQEDYISDASVVIVLVGPNTKSRKHVDWEISAGLNKKLNGYSGLAGILLPNFKLQANGNYFYSDIPPRLADNIQSGYAKMYRWDYACTIMKDIIEEAFQKRISSSDKINNSRIQARYDGYC